MRNLLLPPVLALLCLIAIVALRLWAPGLVLLRPPATWLGLVPVLAGLALLLAGSRRFARVGTNIRTFDDPDVLVVDGPFRFTRNPMYLGFLLALLGAAMLAGTAAGLAVAALFFAAAQFWYIPFEERAMRRRFGDAYEAYRRRVRPWL